MAKTAAFALCTVLVLAAVDFGSCLRCYQCNSQSDPTCGDPFNAANKKLVDCSSNEVLNYNVNYLGQVLNGPIEGVTGSQRSCHKLVFQTGTVVRTCLDVNAADPGHTCRLLTTNNMHNTNKQQQVASCRFCDNDACNGAGSLTASLPLAALVAVVSYLFYKQ